MRVEPHAAENPRDVLRALRAALNGSGPALGLGAAEPADAPAGTAAVVTTSGSTGVPKAVVLSRHALTASAMATAARIGEGAWLLALPSHYVAGLQVLVRSLVQGREPAILAGRFQPAAFAAVAASMRSSHGGQRVPAYTSLVPAQLQTLVDAAEENAGIRTAIASFESILVGGQALPPALRERAAAVGARVVRTYGASETAGGCIYDGVPLDGVRVAAVGGELRIAGPTLAEGYLGDAARTASTFALDEEGARWYRTGDAGAVEGGVVRVDGRIDNVIISGGINISLDRVEWFVHSVLALAGAVVVGVPDDRWGQASVIVAQRAASAADSSADAALLEQARDAVAAGIGPHARPARLVWTDEMPRLASGKPDRRAIGRLV